MRSPIQTVLERVRMEREEEEGFFKGTFLNEEIGGKNHAHADAKNISVIIG